MTAEIAKALSAFQAEMPTVKKSQTANVPTKAGGSYSYTRASLADVVEAAMPLLTKHGLSFSCLPQATERGYDLVGTLLHTSGESLSGALPIQGNAAQEIGSSLTYGRRYLFGCITGLVTDDDDDGALAHNAHPTRQGSTRKVSEKQVEFMGTLMSKLGMTDRDMALAFVRDVVGRDDVASRKDLTASEASKVIDALKRDLDGADPSNREDPWANPPGGA